MHGYETSIPIVPQFEALPEVHIAMENCSVITASFLVGEEQQGAIAIIGPTRMDYRRVVTLLDVMTNSLSRAFFDKKQ